jgi:hypothetical protein
MHPKRHLRTAILALAVIGACSPTPSIPPTTSAGSPTASSPIAAATPAPSPTPRHPATMDWFDRDVAAAIAVAQSLPPPDGTISTGAAAAPDCKASQPESSAAQPTQASRSCSADFAVSDHSVSVMVMSVGSRGIARLIAGVSVLGSPSVVMTAPKLGDEARMDRAWGSERPCTEMLTVRTGTLVIAASDQAGSSPSPADCGDSPLTAYLEAFSSSLVQSLAAYGSIGLVVDDPAVRNQVVGQILAGTLRPGERDLVALPPDLASASDTGQVVAVHGPKGWTIVFFENRGIVDHYTGWVYRSSGKLDGGWDPLGGGQAKITRIDAHWFYVVS